MENEQLPVLTFQNFHHVDKVSIVMYMDFEVYLKMVQTCQQGPTTFYGVYINVDNDTILQAKTASLPTSMKIYTRQDASKHFMAGVVRISTLVTDIYSQSKPK
ncbi:hypothetical protein PR048_020059 [Dryococelus australis]|uniref:Uncharacterized protein n=1 Tax=Dryococelus australis TaxID=614101 RepID=A0ABQ9H581_9NEOP|nr:hypothetical protein PR048_020059 [Dryococelus australis]